MLQCWKPELAGRLEGASVAERPAGTRAARSALPLSFLDTFHRNLLRIDPEDAHDWAIRGLRLMAATPILGGVRRKLEVRDPRLVQTLMGREFPNPVGLAAGFDKNAVAIRGLGSLGFGFLELGTVTPKAQPGNPRPRVFRHREQMSLQNALGFNNQGMEAAAARLEKVHPFRLPLGVNVGKNKDTPQESAADDYLRQLRRFDGRCDYFVINISSPNTPGLRDMQQIGAVTALLEAGREITKVPILVKLAPDLEESSAVRLSRSAVDAGAAGIVLTNTTIDYSLLPDAEPRGGLSGRVLRQSSYRMLQAVASELFGRAILVSVGGIDSAAEAWARLCAGAHLVQVYTGLVYKGPELVRRINEGLLELLDRDGLTSLDEVVGRDLS